MGRGQKAEANVTAEGEAAAALTREGGASPVRESQGPLAVDD